MISYDSTFSLIDTHCHLLHIINKSTISAFSPQELQEIKKILHQAALKNITHVIEVGTTAIDSILCVELAKIFKNVFPVVGIHPHEANIHYQKTAIAGNISVIKNLLEVHTEKIVGIGECGLDKHYPDHNLEAQQALFKAQIELALTYNKALVVHTRDAEQETYAILERYKTDLKRVVIHCYSNSLDFAQAVTSWGWYLGIGGTVTYPKNTQLREIVKKVGLSSIVLETDAPFLPPQIIRGKTNAPEHIQTIAHYLADLLEKNIEEVARITTCNSERLFEYHSSGAQCS